MGRNNGDFSDRVAKTCAMCDKPNPSVVVGGFNNLKFCSSEHALQALKNTHIARALDKLGDK